MKLFQSAALLKFITTSMVLLMPDASRSGSGSSSASNDSSINTMKPWASRKFMNNDDLIRSPLDCEFTREDIRVYVFMYRVPEDATWTLEIEHADGNTIWGDRFPTDQEALDELMLVIDIDGIGAVLSEPHVTSSQPLASSP